MFNDAAEGSLDDFYADPKTDTLALSDSLTLYSRTVTVCDHRDPRIAFAIHDEDSGIVDHGVPVGTFAEALAAAVRMANRHGFVITEEV